MGPLIALILDPPHGFQSQGDSLTCTDTCLHLVNLRVRPSATPTFSANRGVLRVSMCIQQARLPGIPHASSGGHAAV